MSILSQLIKNSKLNSNEKRRWKKRGTIPCEAINTLWELGIVLETEPPKTGMGIMRFLGLLWEFTLSCPNNKISAEALNLYVDTVRIELMPDWRLKMRPKKPRIIWPERKEKPITITKRTKD